eukprot:TRINITY_DN70712_c0_g1_i1.p1 TRINITY_DN70712_c0_g1~~TRINITY_DN70712_c0_g1_i1.p1  ORF type:complete len:383 (-),score=47.59 TRINITY_DN70712_c0_g1_i1:3-1073(-)
MSPYVRSGFNSDCRSCSTKLIEPQLRCLRNMISLLALTLVMASVANVDGLLSHSNPRSSSVAVEKPNQPRDLHGNVIPQVLADEAAAGKNIMLTGDQWTAMDEISRKIPLTKGALRREATALVLIDMQPLFYDASSPWGCHAITESCQGPGLLGSGINEIWKGQLTLAQDVHSFTGRIDSIFLTRYIVPENSSNQGSGIRGLYFSKGSGRLVTKARLREVGANVTYLLDVMPELQQLVEAGAQVSSKVTAGIFGPESTLPLQLDRYFSKVGNDVTRTLIIAGVETDFCVLSSVLGALDHDYRVIVVTDGITSSQRASGQAQLDYTFRRFGWGIDFAKIGDLSSILRENAQAAWAAK